MSKVMMPLFIELTMMVVVVVVMMMVVMMVMVMVAAVCVGYCSFQTLNVKDSDLAFVCFFY